VSARNIGVETLDAAEDAKLPGGTISFISCQLLVQHQLVELVLGHRLSEEKALGVVYTNLLAELELPYRLHSLDHHLLAQFVENLDDLFKKIGL
jgi:hypothetical protein